MPGRSWQSRRQFGAISVDYRSLALFDNSDAVLLARRAGRGYRFKSTVRDVRVTGPNGSGET